MKILAAGGGSGGHVVPVVAVFKEILKKQPDAVLRFWCDKSFAPQARKIIESEFSNRVKVKSIYSGKFRRYNHLTFWQHFTIPSVVIGNTVDIFKNIFGLFQSIFSLIFWRPNVVFCKGGFVCVPIGIAAWILHIPVVIHDSDAHPGLANRILSRFARQIMTGAPLEFYNYPKNKTTYVGIPVQDVFHKYSAKEMCKFKQELGFSVEKKLILITGGGLGAARLNNAIINQAKQLTDAAQVLLISGSSQYHELKDNIPEFEDFHLKGFIAKDMWKYLAAADIVVARAGATSNLELASLAKPTILVPNARLTGGHQVKNAKVYQKNNAVVVVQDDLIEEAPEILTKKVIEIMNSPAEMSRLGEEFSKFAKPDAACAAADIILSVK